MRFLQIRSILLAGVIILAGSVALIAQSNPNDSIMPKPDTPDNRPPNVREMMAKMQIDQAKKEYEQMMERGEKALKIAEELERTIAADGDTLTKRELEKLVDLEKLVKKIRGDLGGDDDEADAENQAGPVAETRPSENAFKRLQSLTKKLFDELKKTSRFSVSAMAIQSSNAVLKMVRFLRFSK